MMIMKTPNIVNNMNRTQNKLNNIYNQMIQNKRITSAKDSPSEIGKITRLESQMRARKVTTQNAKEMQNLCNTADTGLSGIKDNLIRMKELVLQANDALTSQDDRVGLIEEFNRLNAENDKIVKNTKYGNITLLDGTFSNKNAATQPNGGGMKVSIGNVSLEALNLKGYDLNILEGKPYDPGIPYTPAILATQEDVNDGRATTVGQILSPEVPAVPAYFASQTDVDKGLKIKIGDTIAAINGQPSRIATQTDVDAGLFAKVGDYISQINEIPATDAVPLTSDQFESVIKTTVSILDSAISKVSQEHSRVGATVRTLDHSISYNETQVANFEEAYEKTIELDVARASVEYYKLQGLQEYQANLFNSYLQSSGNILKMLI